MNVDDLLKLERNRAVCNWIPTYGFVGNLARSIGAERVCEVGVAYGYHAEHLLDHLDGIEYQGVDPYRAGYDPNDRFATDVAALFAGEAQMAMDRLYAAVNCKLTRYNGRANVLRKPSVDGAARFSDGYFDLVYIDGDHTYQGVLDDLDAWYGKVRPGGIFCGDDLNWPGVRQAVTEFMSRKGKDVIGHYASNPGLMEKWSVAM